MLKQCVYRFDSQVGMYLGQDPDTDFLIFGDVVNNEDITGTSDHWSRYPAEHLKAMKDWEQNGKMPDGFLKHRQLHVNPKLIKEIVPMDDYFTERKDSWLE